MEMEKTSPWYNYDLKDFQWIYTPTTIEEFLPLLPIGTPRNLFIAYVQTGKPLMEAYANVLERILGIADSLPTVMNKT